MTEVEQLALEMLKVALAAAPSVMQAIQAWNQGVSNPYDPIHQQVSDVLAAGKAELEAARK